MPINLTSIGCRPVPHSAVTVLGQQLVDRLVLESVSSVVFTDETPRGEYYPAWCWRPLIDPDMQIHIHFDSWDSPRRLLKLYLHELSHVLIVRADPQLTGHNWPFAAMNAVLLRRAEGHLSGRANDPLITGLTLYDVGDEPEPEWPNAIQKALQISLEMAPTSWSAEECAEAIASKWHAPSRKRVEKSRTWQLW
jgi:hypothetical protein